MHQRLHKLPLTAALWLTAAIASAQGEGVISINERVTGNQEQPKVIYIVPWQAAEGPLGVEGPVQSLLGEGSTAARYADHTLAVLLETNCNVAEAARRLGAHAVIAIGGGSVIDSAKVFAAAGGSTAPPSRMP